MNQTQSLPLNELLQIAGQTEIKQIETELFNYHSDKHYEIPWAILALLPVLEQGLADFFYKGPDGKSFELCHLCYKPSTLWLW